ncbi:hypothetical protein M2275_006935 [Rhodococcus opacus]|nr:hypothetical protein [Rhodococcus opacus]
MDDVFVMFGMTPRRYHRRIARILCVTGRDVLSAKDTQILEQVLDSIRRQFGVRDTRTRKSWSRRVSGLRHETPKTDTPPT